MSAVVKWLCGLWLFLAIYFLVTGWGHYKPVALNTLQPLQNSESKTIAQQLQATLLSSHSQQAQALLLDGRTNAVEASVTCRSKAFGGGCGEDPSFVHDRWEPGSVFKPLLVATMVDDGYIQTNSSFSDRGYIVAEGNRIDNHTDVLPAKYTIEQFLGTSRNTGAVTILKVLENQSDPMAIWHAKLAKIIPGDQGHIPDFKHVRDPQYRFYESSFGVGITVTPLRLAQLYNAFQNDGKVCNEQGLCSYFIKPATAQYMQQLLERVATNYADVSSDNPRCVYGGKSGTALAAQSNGSYAEDVNMGTYVGMIRTVDKHDTVLLIRLTAPNDQLASRPARLTWTPTANKLCQNL